MMGKAAFSTSLSLSLLMSSSVSVSRVVSFNVKYSCEICDSNCAAVTHFFEPTIFGQVFPASGRRALAPVYFTILRIRHHEVCVGPEHSLCRAAIVSRLSRVSQGAFHVRLETRRRIKSRVCADRYVRIRHRWRGLQDFVASFVHLNRDFGVSVRGLDRLEKSEVRRRRKSDIRRVIPGDHLVDLAIEVVVSGRRRQARLLRVGEVLVDSCGVIFDPLDDSGFHRI